MQKKQPWKEVAHAEHSLLQQNAYSLGSDCITWPWGSGERGISASTTMTAATAGSPCTCWRPQESSAPSQSQLHHQLTCAQTQATRHLPSTSQPSLAGWPTEDGERDTAAATTVASLLPIMDSYYLTYRFSGQPSGPAVATCPAGATMEGFKAAPK